MIFNSLNPNLCAIYRSVYCNQTQAFAVLLGGSAYIQTLQKYMKMTVGVFAENGKKIQFCKKILKASNCSLTFPLSRFLSLNFFKQLATQLTLFTFYVSKWDEKGLNLLFLYYCKYQIICQILHNSISTFWCFNEDV